MSDNYYGWHNALFRSNAITDDVQIPIVRVDLGSGVTQDPATGSFKVRFADTPNLDGFSRVRVSQPAGLFEVQCQYNAAPLQMEVGVTGVGVTGAHSTNTRMVALTVATGTGSSFIQSYEYIPYQAGKSQLAFITFVLATGVASATVDVGLFDAANGIFLRQNGTSGLQLIRRTSTSGTVSDAATVDRADWNIDPMDGTGPSGITLDETKSQILVITGQFLGMGRVIVGFDIDGEVWPVHEFLNANVLAVPYMQTLTLPVQMLVTGDDIATAKTAYFKCASVNSEGGSENLSAFQFSTREQTVTAASATRTHLVSVRPALTFNGIPNRTRFQLESIDLLVTGNQPIVWELAVGSTFTAGPTWTGGAVDATYSSYEQTTAVGTVNAVGVVIASGYVVASATSKQAISKAISTRYPITLDRAGAQRAMGTLSLHVTGIGGVSACRAILNYSELR